MPLPWTQNQDDIVRTLAAAGAPDAVIRTALLPLRPTLTITGVAQRRNLLGVKKARGGAHHRRRVGESTRCLTCGTPFRSRRKHDDRLCRSCRDKATEIAA